MVTTTETLRAEARRAGVTLDQYRARLERGELWCHACHDWHHALAFPADARRHTGRGPVCYRVIRAEARARASQ